MDQVKGLKTLFVSGTDGDTRRYRCFHAQEQLELQGVTTGFRESDDPQLLRDVLDYDIFILHRVPYSALISTVVDLAHLRGKPVIFETDDLVFAPELYDHIGFADTLSAEDIRKYRRYLEGVARTFRVCDCVLASTEFLAEEARHRDRPAYVHRNAVSGEMIRLSEAAYAERQRELTRREGGGSHPVVIAYFSGTGSHDRDVRTITAPLVSVLESYPHVWLHISGHLNLGPEFSRFQTRIRRAPYVSWRELPYLIAQVDVNLAPLEPNNPFCRAKSENKFVEAALVGVPTVASRVGAFEFAITDGQDGLLAATPDEWKEALWTLLEDPERRREMGEAARRTAYTRYAPEQQAPRLLKTLETIVREHGSSPAPPEEVLGRLAGGARHYMDHLRDQLAGRESQIAGLRKALRWYEQQMSLLERKFDAETARLRSRLAEQDRAMERQRRVIEELERTISQKEQTIKAIMEGRVMRWMTGVQQRLRRMRKLF